MRTLRFFALVSIIFSQGFLSQEAAGFHQIGFQEDSNYVVIGAFAVQGNAKRFTTYAQRQSFDAKYEMNPNRNLYYVYVMTTDDHQAALDEAVRLRQETEFKDAWVYGGMLGEEASGRDINPETQGDMDVSTIDTDTAGPVMPEPEPIAITVEEESTPVEDEETMGKRFVFDLYRASDREKVQGDVTAIDTDRSRKMATYKGNEMVRVMSPKNNSGKLTFLCDVFGYRKVQHDVDFSDPTANEDIQKDDSGNIIVPFELTRLQKGDIAVMYNVYFFKDAAVMRPESRYEVDNLLAMLKENPNYKIKLHGHTNGSSPGKIISMGNTKNFFSLTDTKEGFGSAKKLADERAQVIREFLINEGVDPNRIDTKSWGGKRPIHDKNSTRAQENVRVEVEILED